MTVICVGDFGGFIFQFVRVMQKAGMDFSLYVPEGYPEQNLENWMVKEKPDWVLTWKKGPFSLLERFKTIRKYDWVQSVGMSTTYVHASGKPYLAYSAGSDLRKVAFQNDAVGLAMRYGFKNARRVLFSNPDQIECFQDLGIRHNQFIPQAMDLNAIRKKPAFRGSTFSVFCPSSLFWPVKGTENLMHAFARFSKGRKTVLRLVQWGPDFEKTKQLVHELHMKDKVEWIPRMSRSKILEHFQDAHVICDQFVIGSMGLASLEAMAAGRPLMTYVKENDFKIVYDELPPVLNAKTIDQIASKLEWAYENQDQLEKMGNRSRKWVEKNHGDKNVAEKVAKIYSDLAVE